MAVAARLHDGQHLGGHVFSQTLGQLGCIDMQHLGQAGDLRGSCNCGAGVVACDQQMHGATQGQRCADCIQGCAFDGGVVMFGNYDRCHC